MFHQGARCAPASSFFPRQQAGKYDIRTVTGLNQSLVVRVVDFQGDPVDMSGITLRGAVRLKTGVAEFGFSRDDEGNGVLSWSSVPAGRWSYDVFMDDGSEESPLLYGRFVSSGRVTPDLPDEQQAVAGAVVVQLPEGSGCVQVMLDNASSAAWYAEQAKKYATNAGNSEVSAANSAAAAASSATDAAASAASAASSSSDAAHSAANAASSEAKAASSEANAMSSATAAAASASNASMSEANAASSQSSAAASASDAASSSASASTSAHNAAASESSAESYAAAASKSASDAATSATSAANSATAAANALAAIPQVDASGNMTLAGGLTAAGTVNANGGINIPLAVGAPTDTSAVNFFYAMGLAGAVQALVQPIYLNSSSITVAGSISKSSNGTLAGLTQRFSVGAASAGSNAYGSAVIPLIGPKGQFNYSSVCGFSLAVNATAFAKFTFGIGRGSKTNRTGLTMDSYSMIPGNNLATNYGEIIDVTINTPYDTVRKGYEIRVREIFYVSSVGHWQVKTTTVFLPVGHNELMPNGLNRLIYMQSGPPSTAVREEKAALYMELGGGSTNTLFKIASLRGFINFEAGTGVSTLIIDARNEKTYALSADAGTGTRHLYANGLTNPTYHALEAMAVNAIESEETADFVDINTPIEES